MLGDCAYLAALWFNYAPAGECCYCQCYMPHLSPFYFIFLGSVLHSHKSRVSQYWVGLMLFLLVVWYEDFYYLANYSLTRASLTSRMTRISLALAIARIFPPTEPTRRFAIGLALLSTIFCLTVVIQSAVVCSKQPALNTGPQAACQWPDSLRTLVVVGQYLFSFICKLFLFQQSSSQHFLGFAFGSHSIVQALARQASKKTAPFDFDRFRGERINDHCHCRLRSLSVCACEMGTCENNTEGETQLL